MGDFWSFITSTEMLPYTFFLGIAVFYWMTVIFGLIDINLLELDVLDSGVEKAMEGGIESVGSSLGALSSLLNFVHVGKVPITIIGSFLILKMWFFGFIFNELAGTLLEDFSNFWIVLSHLFFGGFNFIISTFLTGMTTFPFCGIFEHKTTRGGNLLLGSECKIKTTHVNDDFGQAELQTEDHSYLLISVRCKEGHNFKKGDVAKVESYDEKNNVYYLSY